MSAAADRLWVPVRFAAHLAGRSHQTVHTWIRRGIVRHHGTGTTLRVHLADVVRESATRRRSQRGAAAARHV